MSTARKILWEEMFPDELREAIETCPLCLTCFGLAEPHGPYNAIGLDYLKARALIERSARENGGVVAPPFCWHVQERPEFDWCGKHGVEQAYASSITADLFLQIVLQQVRAFDARGFHAAILVTGHYGGLENDIRLLCEFYTRRTGSPIRLAAFADWELIDFENYRGDHAGVCETSQLMALRPELVDLDRTVENSPLGKFCGSAFPNKSGVMPSAELGESIVSSQIRRLAEVQAELLGSYRPSDGWEAPTLNDVSDLWNRFERLTRKYWWFSRTLGEYGRKSGVDFPGWEELGE
jgi:creatinine amidohydrolase